jgi:putative membrane protein
VRDDEPEPAAGADPTRAAPGVGPHEQDPVAAALSEPAPRSPRATTAGRVWISLALAVVLLVLLIIFVAENSRSVTVSFLGANGHLSLALALLAAAVIGAIVVLLVGSARIVQLRREVRRVRQRHSESGQQRPH